MNAMTALLVIDVQRGLFESSLQPFEAAQVIERINHLAARWRDSGRQVIFIQNEKAGSEQEYGSEGWQLHRDLVTDARDVLVRKTTADSFLRTDLDEQLKRAGVTQVAIAGYASEFCVDTTARRAAALGYGVLLVADAHTTHDKPHACAQQIRAHENATLPDLTSFGPEIRAVTSAEIVAGL